MATTKTAAKNAASQEPVERVEDQEEERESILDLEELLPKRPTVLFRTKEEREADKPAVAYELRVPQEFGIEDENRFRAELGEYSELMNRRDLNKAERAKLVARLNQIFDKVLIAPAEIKARFNDRQRQQVVALFTTALLTEDATAVENAMPMMTTPLLARASSTMAS